MSGIFECHSVTETLPKWIYYQFPKEMLSGILVGGATGCMNAIVTFPADYVKTQMQLIGKSNGSRFSRPFDCVRETIRAHGIAGLYKGLPIVVSGKCAAMSCRFGTSELLKSQISDENGALSHSQKVLCGLAAGLAEAVFVVTPFETLKVKFIQDQGSQHPKYHGISHETRVILKTEGLLGVYKGVGATTLKVGCDQMMRFVAMEHLKEFYKSGDNTKGISKPMLGIMGAVAGALTVFANTPIDVVKTRMQSHEGGEFRNSFHCARTIWRENKFAGFYKGTTPRLSRACLEVALTQMLYDFFSKQFEYYWVDFYNKKFVIEEEIDVLKQMDAESVSSRLKTLNTLKRCVDYLIYLGEMDFDKETFDIVRELHTRFIALYSQL
ncbi:hypothetical protein L3Y34_013601 [Caenorhabditis briggsae]|uniref:Citrate transport protein n=1 Tax=Caenorhabditis briggsae TaxID=6238 RepID=A0AAE8ZVC5_CAEBR|nr:hypothetical protein L3Y34_013601 [Caenorhabditis briggsae]